MERAGVKRLLPGHTLRWREGRVEVSRYWDMRFAPVEASRADLVVLAGPNGGYAQYLTTLSGEVQDVRAPDGVHFSPAGAAIVAREVLKDLNEAYDLTSWRRRAIGSGSSPRASLGRLVWKAAPRSRCATWRRCRSIPCRYTARRSERIVARGSR